MITLQPISRSSEFEAVATRNFLKSTGEHFLAEFTKSCQLSRRETKSTNCFSLFCIWKQLDTRMPGQAQRNRWTEGQQEHLQHMADHRVISRPTNPAQSAGMLNRKLDVNETAVNDRGNVTSSTLLTDKETAMTSIRVVMKETAVGESEKRVLTRSRRGTIINNISPMK